MKNIFIAGITGIGKSTVCKALAQKGHEAHDIEKLKNCSQDKKKKSRKEF